MTGFKITKINTLEDAEYPQPDRFPDGFSREGIGGNPEVGKPFLLWRAGGYFKTSTVTEIENREDCKIIKTVNSTYKIETI